MRVLVVFAHPLADSLNGALHEAVVDGLTRAGHEVDDMDLYADGFDPVLSAEERRSYFDADANRARLEGYAERIAGAEGLVACFPVWCLGPPAIFKGFWDRVLVPGVAFGFDEAGALVPDLKHVRRAATVATYSRPRSSFLWLGDAPRRLMTRYLRPFLAPDARISYFGLYGLQKGDPDLPARFIGRIRREMSGF